METKMTTDFMRHLYHLVQDELDEESMNIDIDAEDTEVSITFKCKRVSIDVKQGSAKYSTYFIYNEL